ncbi:MAG: ABC transporter permease subunit [Candidatus Nanopelagicales bacterium]
MSVNTLMDAPGRLARRLDRVSDRKFGALVSLPGLLVVAIVVLPPVLSVFGMSLFRLNLLKDNGIAFVGFQNFSNMFTDRLFLESIPRTLIFAVVTTVITVPLALGAALALNRVFRGQKILSIFLLLPWAVAPVVTGLFWRFIFQPQFGIATGLMSALGLTDGSIDWLGDSKRAMGVAVVATAWRSLPLIALLIGTALRTIPKNQLKAAELDGAGSWATFRHITLPAIRNMLLVGIVLQVIISLQVFDIIFTLTRGGPGFDTTVMYYYIYNTAFGTLNFGYSSALSVLLIVFIAAFSAPLLYLRQRSRHRVKAALIKAQIQDAKTPMRSLSLMDPTLLAISDKIDDAFSRQYDDNSNRRRFVVPAWLKTWASRIGVFLLFSWLMGPIIWIFVASVQPTAAITAAPPQLTWALTADHFIELLDGAGWYRAIWVSLQVALLSTFLTILVASLAAYPLARLKVPGKGLLLTGLLLIQMVPAISLAIPVLLIFRAVHLQDTIIALVIVNTAFITPLAIWILLNIFEDVPREIESAARMDGCSRIGTLFRIVIPVAKSGVAATAILVMISTWNEFLFAVVLGNRDAVTVTRQIGFLETPHSMGTNFPYDLLAAGGALAALPCILLVIIFHRRIVSGITEGYGKG